MSRLRMPVNEHDHRAGNPDAKIILLEYGDYQCSHCGIAHPLIRKLMNQFSNNLLFVFRNFPLHEVHPAAMMAAQAAEAAGRQDKFWEMHDYIYDHQDELSGNDLINYAEKLKLDLPVFASDWKSQQVLSKIENDFESGIRSGVSGTPSFFINGYKLDSYDESYESLAEAVKEAALE